MIADTPQIYIQEGLKSLSPRAEKEMTLIIGSEEVARKIYSDVAGKQPPNTVFIAQYSDLNSLRGETSVSGIVVIDKEIQGDADTVHTLMDFRLRGVKVESATESFERLARKLWIEGLSPQSLVFTNGFDASKGYLLCKRIFDVLVAGLLLILTGPLMAIIAALIKLDTPGPAVFSQERVGLHGNKFILHKFRSMRQDAESQTGPTWAKENDDRMTSIGAFLRKCRLDELPQLYNVLKGDMSLIGPRPERPYFVDLLKEKIQYYDLRHYVKPGITGWAQVMYPYGASVEDSYHKLQYDLYYAKNASLGFDLLTLLKTIKVVFDGRGR